MQGFAPEGTLCQNWAHNIFLGFPITFTLTGLAFLFGYVGIGVEISIYFLTAFMA